MFIKESPILFKMNKLISPKISQIIHPENPVYAETLNNCSCHLNRSKKWFWIQKYFIQSTKSQKNMRKNKGLIKIGI